MIADLRGENPSTVRGPPRRVSGNSITSVEYPMARLTLTLAVLVGLPALLWPQSHSPELPDSLVVEALRNNPDLRAEAQRILAAEGRKDQAGTLEPPMFIYRLEEFPGTEFGQAQFQNFGIMQAIPFPTKLSLESDIASHEQDRTSFERKVKMLEVIAEVRSGAAMLWGTRTMLAINRDNQELLRRILSSAQTRYAVGKTSQQDVLKADIELTRLESQEIEFEQELASSEAMMRSLINRPISEPIGPVVELPVVALDMTLEQYRTIARHNSPALAADSVSVARADRMLSLRNHQYYPDLLLDIERVTMPVGGPSSWSVMATVSLPFAPWTLGRASAGIQEAKAEKSEMQSRFVAAATSLDARVAKAYARARGLEHQMNAYRDRILPQTEQSIQSLLTAYQTGMTDFLMLLDGYRTYQEVRMELARITTDYHQAFAELEREAGLTGFSVPVEENQP